MPACIKAPLHAPAFVCAGRCISGPGCLCAGAKNLPAPFFPGRIKAGDGAAASEFRRSGAPGAYRGAAASQEEYAAAAGAACTCRTIPNRRPFSF